MINDPLQAPNASIMEEAVNRIRVARDLIDHFTDDGQRDQDFGGYQWEIVREVLEDVAATLEKAAR